MSHPSEQELVMFALGEAESGSDLGHHVETCPHCRSELAAVRQVLRATAGMVVPEPDASFEERIWRRQVEHLNLSGTSDRALTLETAPTVEIAPVAAEPIRRDGWGFSRLVLVGAMAATVVLAFLIGLYSAPPGTEIVPEAGPEGVLAGDPVGGDVDSDAAMPGRDRILLIAVGDHLERARMVLVELVNAEAPDGPVDVRPQQVRAEQLLANNRLYRQSASLQGQNDVADVLEEIERVLVEVARSPGEMDSAEVEWLRQRIVSRDLLFKVKVIEGRGRWNNDAFLRPMDAL